MDDVFVGCAGLDFLNEKHVRNDRIHAHLPAFPVGRPVDIAPVRQEIGAAGEVIKLQLPLL